MKSYDSATFYDSLGWKLVHIPPRTKNPVHTGWNKTHTAPDYWIENPDYNMGLQLGASGIVSFDIDNQEYTRLIFYNLGIDYDQMMEQCPRIASRAGHDKALFRAPAGIELSTKKLSWGKTTIFELRAGAVQDVLPPSIHPDTGMPYTWKRGPEAGIPELPEKLLSIWVEWAKFRPQLEDMQPGVEPRAVPPSKPRAHFRDSESVISRYNAAIDITTLLDRYGYVKKSSGRYVRPGSSTGIPGVVVFPHENKIFSHHGGEPFDSAYSQDAFSLYTVYEHNGNVAAAVKAAAKELEIPHYEYDPEAIEHGKAVTDAFIKKKRGSVKAEQPEACDLLSVPGVLQQVVDYYQATALKPQPEFAVACALAIGGVCMSRQWRSSQNNYTALYFLLLGKSSTGKEHSKTVIETVLRAAGPGCEELIGPPGYTSAGAIVTQLKSKPRHICIQDEMGKQLQHAAASANSQKDAAYTMLMELFGRQAGFLSSDAYSNLAGKRHDDDTSVTIERPALSVLGISTPSTLYKAINSDSISSGYLPRFLIIESSAERELSRWIDDYPDVSQTLIDWCRACAMKTGDSGNLSAYTNPPEPYTVKFNQACRVMLEEYEREIINIQNGLDAFGIAELWGRVKEIAQRISLIIAVSCESDQILPEHLDWAMRYVKKHFLVTTDRVQQVVSNSDFEAVCKEVLSIIKKSGAKGSTRREINRASPMTKALDEKALDGVFATLETRYGVVFANVAHKGAGRPRAAYVYPAEEEGIMS